LREESHVRGKPLPADAPKLSKIEQIAKYERELKAQLKSELSNWRGWTWRRHCIAQQMEE
jgi:hypothetical protein